MKILLGLFFLSLTLGQLAGIPVNPTTTVYAHDLMLPLIFVATLFRKKFVKPKLIVPIVSFVGAGLLSLLVNITRFPMAEVGQSSLYLFRWVLYAGIYWVAIQDVVSAFFWLWGLYLSGILLAVFGLVQYVWYPYLRNLSYLGWDPHLYRVFSTFFDPNFLGLLFVFTLFLGIYLWNKKYRLLLGFGQGVVAIAFLLTYSRSSYLAFIVSLIVFLGFLKQWKALLGICVLFVVMLTLLPRPAGEGVNLFRSVSTLARFGDWERGLVLIRDAPLFGYGFNTLRYVQQVKGWVDESQVVSKAAAGLDNSFEFIWATTGLIGLLVYFWLLREMYKLAHSRFGMIYLAMGAGLVVQSFFINSLFYPWTALWWWILTGVLERT